MLALTDPVANPGQAAIEARLERAAEVLGDLTAPVMAEFYCRYPDARASFAHHSPHNPARLEAEMVGNTLYYVMTWFESPTEARIEFSSTTEGPFASVSQRLPKSLNAKVRMPTSRGIPTGKDREAVPTT